MPSRHGLLAYQTPGFEIVNSSSSDNIEVLTCPLSVEAPFRVSNASIDFPLHSLYSQISICHFTFLLRWSCSQLPGHDGWISWDIPRCLCPSTQSHSTAIVLSVFNLRGLFTLLASARGKRSPHPPCISSILEYTVKEVLWGMGKQNKHCCCSFFVLHWELNWFLMSLL